MSKISMFSISLKIAYPIILAGLFIIVAFIALNYQTLNQSFYIILSLLIAYIFLFGFATGQNFASPVKKLLKRADDLSKGDLKSRFYSENKDELGELARVFNKIAEEFEQSKTETDSLKKSVDIKVQARTQALEETINALEQKVKNRTFEIQKIAGELEKLQKEPQLKDGEVAGLKKQIAELKAQLASHKTKKVKKEEEEVTA